MYIPECASASEAFRDEDALGSALLGKVSMKIRRLWWSYLQILEEGVELKQVKSKSRQLSTQCKDELWKPRATLAGSEVPIPKRLQPTAALPWIVRQRGLLLPLRGKVVDALWGLCHQDPSKKSTAPTDGVIQGTINEGLVTKVVRARLREGSTDGAVS